MTCREQEEQHHQHLSGFFYVRYALSAIRVLVYAKVCANCQLHVFCLKNDANCVLRHPLIYLFVAILHRKGPVP